MNTRNTVETVRAYSYADSYSRNGWAFLRQVSPRRRRWKQRGLWELTGEASIDGILPHVEGTDGYPLGHVVSGGTQTAGMVCTRYYVSRIC